jgi:hypothetical protein
MSRDVKPITVNFKGGLNTYSDQTAVADTQVVEALNVDQDLDGSLRSRPPFENLSHPLDLGTSGTARLLGWYYYAGISYLIASDGLSSTWRYNSTTAAWTLISNTFSATAMIQFDDKAWLPAPYGAANPGGRWDPVGGYVAEPNMPKGATIAAYKERLFVARGRGNPDGAKIYYSNVFGSATFWPVTPAEQRIGSGDGQDIVYLTVYYSSLLIFRSESIWNWTYASSPGAGTISLVVPGVGLEQPDTVAAYENTLYFMYDSKAYAFINNRAEHINPQVPFVSDDPASASIAGAVSTYNKRVIFTYYDTLYIFNLLTSTWTRWRSTAYGPIGQIMQSTFDLIEVGYALTSAAIPNGAGRQQKLLRITDRVTSAKETMVCIIQTKNFSFQVPSNFKIMHRWGMDARFNGEVVGSAVPVVYTAATTWDKVGTKDWDELGLWDNLLGGDQLVEITTIDEELSGPSRRYVKMRKRFRFRQAYFRIEFHTDGDLLTAPAQLFSILAYVDTRQGAVKAVS